MTGTNSQPQSPQHDEKAEQDLLDFETHYGVSSKRVRDILLEILLDMSTYKNVHNWDAKLVASPLKMLATAVQGYLAASNLEMFNNLLADSMVDEILTVGGVIHRKPAIQREGEIDSHLFFTKPSTNEKRDAHRPLENTDFGSSTSRGRVIGSEKPSQGRIVYIAEHISHGERAVLLLLHTFCIRLQNEDYGYIRAFIERHLSLQCFMKVPYHWQQTSPPEIDSSRQRCYKRVSLSFHITYLTLNPRDAGAAGKNVIDRTMLFPLHHDKVGNKSSDHSLFKASFSVLLTLVIPEESRSREEEIKLLRLPQGLWTILVVNCPLRFVSDQEPEQHLTPIAQFLRGVTSSLHTQTTNAESIYEILREQLKSCEGGSLFDDEHFTKSTVYHWTIKACDELKEPFDSSLRFVKKFSSSQLLELRRDAHPQEKLGVNLWMRQMEDEIFVLEDLRAQVCALSTQAQESRTALHGVTGVLEARVALQQGDRLKMLAYLATLYLPLTATSSLYSMSVLPKSASFPSFFVVFTIFLLSTICMDIYLPTLLSRIRPPLLDLTAKLFRLTKDSARSITSSYKNVHALKPSINLADPAWVKRLPEKPLMLHWISEWAWWIFRDGPTIVVRELLIPELFFPCDQYRMYPYIGHTYLKIQWHALAFIRDIFRLALLPIWVVVIILLVCWVAVLTGLTWTFKYVWRLRRC
ncbi:hypothetical protein K469DRAFT_642743 [Zopfia rhizophila CBS 207.26]|uniref:Uncharacterized protein n=1 Tax=Zopfia rhizophila CBS 207.26 TaxID=1314779 RepID=A0A6A6DFZ4_9PEZI|nr:hypothetical protein K469DRAFT_642743 [Zopfia rhizophila CBS 207.26]